MWFVFPQLRGLGRSPTAEHYGITDIDEAREYLAHDVLGVRLTEISTAMMLHQGTPARAILGPVDTLKLRSSMTLFRAAGDVAVFDNVLAAFFDGHACDATLEMIGEG